MFYAGETLYCCAAYKHNLNPNTSFSKKGDYWLSMAISKDPDGKAGTWFKYAGPRLGFINPGLGGTSFAVGGKQNADGSFAWGQQAGMALRPGSNPGIHFNVYLNKVSWKLLGSRAKSLTPNFPPSLQWVMIWQAWSDNSLYISANADISNPDGWETPRFLTGSVNGFRAWHATVVCEGGGSAFCTGNTGRIYYSDEWGNSDRRAFVSRTITFSRND